MPTRDCHTKLAASASSLAETALCLDSMHAPRISHPNHLANHANLHVMRVPSSSLLKCSAAANVWQPKVPLPLHGASHCQPSACRAPAEMYQMTCQTKFVAQAAD
jgi:hypothetical protein